MDRNPPIWTLTTHKILSLSARRAWIEIWWLRCWQLAARSLSARRAWIEIRNAETLNVLVCVALRKESVDRNLWWGVRKAVGSLVALRKESVDRNRACTTTITICTASLSARRAWIEIA